MIRPPQGICDIYRLARLQTAFRRLSLEFPAFRFTYPKDKNMVDASGNPIKGISRRRKHTILIDRPQIDSTYPEEIIADRESKFLVSCECEKSELIGRFFIF
jgi:hypothetical protein